MKKPILSYTFTTSPYGRMFVAGTQIHLYALFFTGAQSDETIVAEAKKQLKGYTLLEEAPLIAPLAEKIFTPTPPPLVLNGTPFQKEVWRMLQAIPRGRMSTYTDIAQALGRPSSVRAVANAVGRNLISYLIPCHRVIRKDYSLGGYRWGIDIKEKMLADEKR